MTTIFRRVQGDIGDTINPILDGIQDLTTVTNVEAHVWRTGIAAETLEAEVLDPVARILLVHLGDATGWLVTAAPNVWRVEYALTFADGTELTWPASGNDWIMVRAQGS